MDIKYINHKKEVLNLSDWPIVLQPEPLFNFAWQYRARGSQTGRQRIDKFYMGVVEKPLTVVIHTKMEDEFNAAMERFFEVTQKDVAAGEHGRIQLDNGYYLACWILTDDKAMWDQGIKVAFRQITLITDEPKWIREKTVRFGLASEATAEADGHNYPYNYPYNYSSGSMVWLLDNDEFLGASFRLILYGEITNPSIQIGRNIYAMGYTAAPFTIASNSYVEIDSKKQTIMYNNVNGQISNVFEHRVLEHNIFEPIPVGVAQMSGNCNFDITVFQERPEPKWNL